VSDKSHKATKHKEQQKDILIRARH